MVEDHPGSGWIVEPDADAIYAAARRLIENPALAAEARAPAMQSGQAFSWTNYRARAGQLMQDFLQ
jgi:glycosyltransferase involved in cell wall biosynthesis